MMICQVEMRNVAFLNCLVLYSFQVSGLVFEQSTPFLLFSNWLYLEVRSDLNSLAYFYQLIVLFFSRL